MLGNHDSVDLQARDTQDAGAGMVDERVARFIAEHSAAAIEWLVEAGASKVPLGFAVRPSTQRPAPSGPPAA